MDKRLRFKFLLVMSLLLIFYLKDCPNANTITYNHNNTINSIMFTIPLPFNSHITDQYINKKSYTDNTIPFP